MNQQIFTYRHTFSYWVFLFPTLCLGLASYCFMYNAAIAYRSHRFLEAPYSYYVTGGLGVLSLLYVGYSFFKVQNANRNTANITVGDSLLSFPKGGDEVVRVNFLEINELWIKDDSDDGESVIIYTKPNNDRHEFFAVNFQSISTYIDFKRLMERRCIYITNSD
ncbi:hypothetical protein ABW636_18335 [Aquimarina sp. 2201CG1-2-11]